MKLSALFSRVLVTATLLFSVSALANHHMNDKKDIVDTAASNPDFSTLVTALKAAGITDVLKDAGPFTVFAPTNEAFEALPAGTLEMLLKPENKEKLVQILTYHVVPGKVTAAEVVKMDDAETVEGADIDITATQNEVMVNDAKVVKTDIMTSNGIIHVIDKVIMPAELSASL